MLRNLRNRKKLTQEELAKKLGISQSYLSKLENEHEYHANVTMELIVNISIELNTSPIMIFIYFLKSYRRRK
ncbi:helix-turn-helix domain-containing protein [Clostridium sp. YIM B02551]|uniref:helix-turn-helix domain-containing protein n=1 Tax=Clostridium sp. YIM B02551 TaxID=2910679 RepID=UPI001EEB56D7|nr:helix-turn-helix transcriptional regulator [Clostridium sp. YIM B02551]